MRITREQIEQWSQRPSSFFPEWTKNILKGALAHAPQLHGKCSFETYVQGSYANETNIHGNSDVDLVVQMRMPFEEQIRRLTGKDKQHFWETYGDTVYGWPQFRADVVARLHDQFFVHEAKKCIDIRNFDSLVRIPADIVPAIEYREYSGFPSFGVEQYLEGIFFRDRSGHPIINFPKRHLRNGRRKDAEVERRFKPIVRVFKNARDHCDGFDPAKAPSYFVECLVYNIDNTVFRQPLRQAYPACVHWLLSHFDKLDDLNCQNGVTKLFGKGRTQWDVESAKQLILALKEQLPS